jgi:hypothetical protein
MSRFLAWWDAKATIVCVSLPVLHHLVYKIYKKFHKWVYIYSVISFLLLLLFCKVNFLVLVLVGYKKVKKLYENASCTREFGLWLWDIEWFDFDTRVPTLCFLLSPSFFLSFGVLFIGYFSQQKNSPWIYPSFSASPKHTSFTTPSNPSSSLIYLETL